MLDRCIVLTSIRPEKTADVPAACETRVQRERPIDQSEHHSDILPEIRQHEGRVGEDTWVIFPYLKGLPSKLNCREAGRVRLFGPSVKNQSHFADRGPG